MRLLITDDDQGFRQFLRDRLIAGGYEVTEAEDGQMAWELFQRERFRIVITDWTMPNLNGPDLVRNIRSMDDAGYTYVIMLTALEEKSDVVTGLEAGADEYLTKPFNSKELLARVATGERILQIEANLSEAHRQMEELAARDGLTNLLNRRAIEEHAQVELSRARRQNSPLSIILIDLDHFKSINDRYGHQNGDQALRQVATILTQYVRPYDWAGRWGGEEFLMILPGASLKDASAIAERIRINIAETPLVLINGQEAQLQASLGVAGAASEDDEEIAFDELVRQADEALYRAKREGRDRVCVYGN